MYVAYLVRCRQGLLGVQAHIDKLRQRVERYILFLPVIAVKVFYTEITICYNVHLYYVDTRCSVRHTCVPCRDKVLCTKHFLTVYARLFLKRRQLSVNNFVADFQQLSVADEKVKSCCCHCNKLPINLLR